VTAPLFLVGAQRSGTTALAHALSAQYPAQRHGTFTVNGKLWYFVVRWLDAGDLAARHFRADEIGHALRRRPAQGAAAAEWLGRVDGALGDLAGHVARGRYAATRDGVLAARRDLAGAIAGPRPWGDKYNEYLLQLPELHATFPDARWIFLRRHPAEVIASMLAWAGDRPWNPAAGCDAEAKWRYWNSRWLAFRSSLRPSRLLELDYEDLCSGTAHQAVQEFTQLDLSEPLRDYRRRGGGRQATVSTAAERLWTELGNTATSPDVRNHRIRG
jgi:hypothetical protein